MKHRQYFYILYYYKKVRHTHAIRHTKIITLFLEFFSILFIFEHFLTEQPIYVALSVIEQLFTQNKNTTEAYTR